MEVDDLRRTALFDAHERLGARMAPFGGWSMPLQYEGTLAEHEAVRTGVGVFDVSHLGRVRVTGPGALATVLATFTNDAGALGDGQAQYTLCCQHDGGILDDLLLYRLEAEHFLAVPNASNTAAVVAAMREAADGGGAQDHIEDVTAQTCMLAVQGPRSLQVVEAVTGVDAAGVDYLHTVAAGDVLVCRTGYTGEVGAELIADAEQGPKLFDAVLDAGAAPCGLGARDTLRLEMGYPLHGNDISPDTHPFEAGLSFGVRLDRPPFRGQEALRAARRQEGGRRLRGLLAADRGIPRPGMRVHVAGADVGEVTSGTFSPTLRRGIGLAYLDAGVTDGASVHVDVRGRDCAFDVVRPPFVDRDPRG